MNKEEKQKILGYAIHCQELVGCTDKCKWEVFEDYINAMPEDECSVTDKQGNHCPETPVMEVNIDGEDILLCEKCLCNVIRGAYGKQIARRKIEEYRYSKRDMPLNIDNVLDDLIDWLDREEQ